MTHTCLCPSQGHDYRCRSALNPFAHPAPAAARSRLSETTPYTRAWAADVEILRGKDGAGDGRTVRAYCAVFDTPAEITDPHGHYVERIDRRAFNKQLAAGIDGIKVFYNHAMTLHGTPSGDASSVPIGSPVDIRADSKGLLTTTRFNRSPLADSVFEAIRAGDLRGYSFRGRIFRSNPERIPRTRTGGVLPTVVRLELGLSEYGPVVHPAYADASIVSVDA